MRLSPSGAIFILSAVLCVVSLPARSQDDPSDQINSCPGCELSDSSHSFSDNDGCCFTITRVPVIGGTDPFLVAANGICVTKAGVDDNNEPYVDCVEMKSCGALVEYEIVPHKVGRLTCTGQVTYSEAGEAPNTYPEAGWRKLIGPGEYFDPDDGFGGTLEDATIKHQVVALPGCGAKQTTSRTYKFYEYSVGGQLFGTPSSTASIGVMADCAICQ